MKLVLSCLLLMVLATSAAQAGAQATPRASTPHGQRKLLETVTMSDGREIRLYDDLTYEVRQPAPQVARSKVTIDIKAGVITGGGDVKPVARTDFLIFKEDIVPTLAMLNKPLNVFDLSLLYYGRIIPDDARDLAAALEKLKPITQSTVTTDFGGNASFQLTRSDAAVWIYGYFQVGQSFCAWYFTITPNKNASLILDNKSAKYCG